ncbi:hypothetical protein I5907_18270 [Panacibacter sp. DH6]|uniref:CCDC81-like prokaryotic HU domain-containing protein n=1 Tax=Panacibacter microcysteis TaxID=2793269 RepID=A0A931GZG6_9BACT|nr:hypothetical protein [Panacibacter microcysteis]MBG9378190.1 hypothetical protein [Panacibacter microcysteis]
MNHYDTLIRDYIYEHRQVSFEKVGELVMEGHSPADPASFKFTYNKRAATTPELIVYIAEKTGKNKALIASDIESFVELMRQFMNIGKPYELEGVGMFKLGSSGTYEFAPFDPSHRKEEPRKQKMKQEAPLMVKKSSNKGVLTFIALLIVLGVLGVVGWGTYKLFLEKSTANAEPSAAVEDTAAQVIQTPVVHDSATVVKDSVSRPDSAVIAATGDSAFYKFVHETTTSAARAYQRTNALKAFKHPSFVDSTKKDTVTYYTLYLRYKLKTADTTVMRDSLQKLLGRKISIKQ